MRLDNNLTEDNFLEFALKSYTNIRCQGIQEFEEDLLHIKYLGRLFKKYRRSGVMDKTRVRLCLNHIIILYNVFRIDAITKMLFLKIEKGNHSILKTFLFFLNFQPAIIYGINGKDITIHKIKMDKHLLRELQQI